MFPSDEQTAVIKNLINLLTVKKKDCAFCGPAGSGKSSTVGELLNQLAELKIPVALTAMTNRAARSLEDAIKETSGFYPQVSTIHSFLKLKPAKKGLIRRKNAKDESPFNGIIVVDESSMLDSSNPLVDGIGSLWFFILQFKKENPDAVFLFVGDVYQLPPINEDVSIVFSERSKLPLNELTEVHRQNGANPIGWIANTFRLAQDGETLPRLQTTVNDKNEGIIELSREEYDEAALESQGRAMFLSFTNRGAIYYDKMIRNAITKHDRHVHEGEQLIANEPFVSGEEILIANCEMVEVVDVDYDKSMYGIPYTSVDVTTEIGDLVTVMLPEDEMYKRSCVDARWKKSFELRNKNKHDEAQALINEANAISILFSDLRYGYGSTIHKSQGQSINIVFVDLDNVAMMKDDTDMLKSLYVAFSRGKKRIYFTGKLPERLFLEKEIVFPDDIPF